MLQTRTDGNTDRPEAADVFQQLLDLLWDLHLKTKDPSMLERYDYIIRHSKMGRACTYAMKAKGLFYLKEYKEIKELIAKINSCIQEIEGKRDNG